MARQPDTPENARIVGWRAWYTGGRAYDSDTTRWEDLPREGVLVFVLYQREKKRRRMLVGQDYYWKHGETYGSDNDSAKIPTGIDGRFVKLGKEIDYGKFLSVQAAAFATMKAPDESVRI